MIVTRTRIIRFNEDLHVLTQDGDHAFWLLADVSLIHRIHQEPFLGGSGLDQTIQILNDGKLGLPSFHTF